MGKGDEERLQVRGIEFQLNSRANKNISKLTTRVVNCPASFFYSSIAVAGGCSWGMGFCKSWRGSGRRWQDRGMNFQLNSLADKDIAKHKNQPAFFAISQNALLPRVRARSVPTGCSRIYKLTEI